MNATLTKATPEQIEALQALGFYVQDMGRVHGAKFAGKFRWVNDKTGTFQDHDVSFSEAEAWAECLNSCQNN